MLFPSSLLVIALLSPLPRTRHPLFPNLVNLRFSSVAISFIEEVFLDDEGRMRWLDSVFLWYIVHITVIVILHCFKIVYVSISLFQQQITSKLHGLTQQSFIVLTNLGRAQWGWMTDDLSLFHVASAGAALLEVENPPPRWLIHTADKLGPAVGSSLLGSLGFITVW